MCDNPYQSPQYLGVDGCSLEAAMEDGERLLLQISARSVSGGIRHFQLSSPVIGKLVLTTQRTLFLSSGTCGGIAVYSEAAMIERIAKPLGMSALDRASSWQIRHAKLRSVEAPARPFWRTAYLRVAGRDERDAEVRWCLYRCGLRSKVWADVASLMSVYLQ
jgi:hypothetical protein